MAIAKHEVDVLLVLSNRELCAQSVSINYRHQPTYQYIDDRLVIIIIMLNIDIEV